MKTQILMPSLLLLISTAIYGNPPSILQEIQDPQTKVYFYEESDRRHIGAITPEGKLIWRQEAFHHMPQTFIKNFKLRAGGVVIEGEGGVGSAEVIINMKTGDIESIEAI